MFVSSRSALGRVIIFVTLWTVDPQAPLSMGFPRQDYWSGFDVDENVPLRKRSWLRDLESTKGCVLEADLQAGSGGGGVGEGNHPDRGKTPGREGKKDSVHK